MAYSIGLLNYKTIEMQKGRKLIKNIVLNINNTISDGGESVSNPQSQPPVPTVEEYAQALLDALGDAGPRLKQVVWHWPPIVVLKNVFHRNRRKL